MGLQVRKRTKGKRGWWNGSYSRKGVGASGSIKIGENITYNTGDLLNGKTSSRTTFNFGNGIRYVSYGKKKSSNNSAGSGSGTMWGIVFIIALYLIYMSFIQYPFWTVVGVVVAGWVIYKAWLKGD